MDPVAFRKLNAVDTGAEGPSGQTYGEIGLQQCIDAAAAGAGYGQDLPDDEAIGVAIGWWPSFSVPSGAYVKIDGDGSGQIITGAQECGTGAVMTLRQLVADELGMDAENFELVYQDTSVAPYDMGATGSQTLFNNGRAVVAAAGQIAEQLRNLAAEHLEASPADIVLADGVASVAGSPDRGVPIAELAGIAAGGELLIGHGSGTPPGAPPIVGLDVRRRPRHGRLGRAAVQLPRRAREAGPRHRRRPRAARQCRPRQRHHHQPGRRQGQVEGAVLMGIGQALTEGTTYDDRRPTSATQRCWSTSCRPAPTLPRSTSTSSRSTPPTPGRAGRRVLPRRRTSPPPPPSPTRSPRSSAHPMRQLPMTAERVWEALTSQQADGTARHELPHRTIARRGARRAWPPERGPIAGGTDLVVGARHGKAPLPDSWWPSTGSPS